MINKISQVEYMIRENNVANNPNIINVNASEDPSKNIMKSLFEEVKERETISRFY